MEGTTNNHSFERVPRHVAIIMDGNGRWALARGLPRIAGHRAGTENLRRVMEGCGELGIKYLTLYAFSTENWGRPAEEVRGLMGILEDVIDSELAELHREGVQLRHIGVLDRLDPVLREKVLHAVELTKDNDKLILNIAFNYGGRNEIVHAIQNMIYDEVAPQEVTDELVSKYLFTHGVPDRISNFLIWQAAYAEWYFTPVYWLDFDKGELRKAVEEYSQRERRYGLVIPQPA